MENSPIIYGPSLFSDHDIYLFKEGTHYKLYDKLGAHLMKVDKKNGTYFSVWAPNAKDLYVMGDFNNWNKTSHPLSPRWDSSGIWEGFIANVKKKDKYKFYVVSKYNNLAFEKSDPLAFFSEKSPNKSSIVWNFEYEWNDQDWIRNRKKYNSLESPYSIYEVHLGSWKKKAQNSLTYKEFGDDLVEYVKYMGFTFVEFMPIMEHPFNGSWGYQTTGYFSPTSRYGEPEELMYLIDRFHKNGIGVILDWTPAHFPKDEHGLGYFDGTNLYEHSDPRKGFHPDWKSNIFNYGRQEVKAFLISSAIYWFDKFHIDALRIDGVASMLYLDYSRKEGEWVPNEKGGNENLEAIDFIQKLNTAINDLFPDVQTIAEESTAWTGVTKHSYTGGLGFKMKWNMGWMHDILRYFSKNPIYRKYHHNDLTFSFIYSFSENFLLSLSHDEVVHGKGSLLGKMPCDDWQKFANLRLLYGFMYAHPGKKLLFMGSEFAQRNEWHHDNSLDWHLLNETSHKQIQDWVKDLNFVYKNEKSLYEVDFDYKGFEWIDFKDFEKSIISFLRKDKNNNETICFIGNFLPNVEENYLIGVPFEGKWRVILNSDNQKYGGSNFVKQTEFMTQKVSVHDKPYSLNLKLPPLGMMFLKYEKE